MYAPPTPTVNYSYDQSSVTIGRLLLLIDTLL
jgi:hypothetical protein